MNSLFALYCHVDDPIHFEDAIKDKKWIEAMDEEMNAIERNKTWDLVELPKGKEVIGVKWVYKTKCNAEGKIERHKARLVVKGYKQHYGRDYEETFAPVARMETVRAVLSIAAQTSNDDYLIENFKTVMKEEFEMTDMGLLRYFLGIEVDQNENGIFISQARYVNEVLGRFNMQECKAAITPTVMGLKLSKEDSSKDFDPSLYKSIVGSVMYLTATRPDIMFAVSLISRFMERPKEAHW
eukprot:PITA_36238